MTATLSSLTLRSKKQLENALLTLIEQRIEVTSRNLTVCTLSDEAGRILATKGFKFSATSTTIRYE